MEIIVVTSQSIGTYCEQLLDMDSSDNSASFDNSFGCPDGWTSTGNKCVGTVKSNNNSENEPTTTKKAIANDEPETT